MEFIYLHSLSDAMVEIQMSFASGLPTEYHIFLQLQMYYNMWMSQGIHS